MHTRAQKLASPPPSSPPTSSSTRRKRSAITQESGGDEEGPVTPHKHSKRVRFSNATDEQTSSGLTPSLDRSTLNPESAQPSSKSKAVGRRRTSLTTLLPSPESSPVSDVQEIQFTPLKQVLDDRIKRRLRRSHLSEEINDFEHDQRSAAKVRRQVMDRLRVQVTEKEQTIADLMLELEEQRLRGIEVYEDEQKTENLKKELGELKQQLAREHAEAEAISAVETADDNGQWDNHGVSDIIWDDNIVSSPTPRSRFAKSPSVEVRDITPAVKMTDVSTQVSMDGSNQEQIRSLEVSIEQLRREASDAKVALEVVRAELHTLGFSTDEDIATDTLISAIREALRSARLELEYLLPGETTVGLTAGKQLLDSLVAHLKSLVHRAKAMQQSIDIHQQSEKALRRQFNIALETSGELKLFIRQKTDEQEQSMADILLNRTELIAKLEQREQELEGVRDEVEALKRQSEKDLSRIEELGMNYRDSEEENELSITRLQLALEKYREDVSQLEELVRGVEREKIALEGRLKEVDVVVKASAVEAQEIKQSRARESLAYENRIVSLEGDLGAAKRDLLAAKDSLGEEHARVEMVRRGLAEAKEGHEEYKARVKAVVEFAVGELGVEVHV